MLTKTNNYLLFYLISTKLFIFFCWIIWHLGKSCQIICLIWSVGQIDSTSPILDLILCWIFSLCIWLSFFLCWNLAFMLSFYFSVRAVTILKPVNWWFYGIGYEDVCYDDIRSDNFGYEYFRYNWHWLLQTLVIKIVFPHLPEFNCT